MRQDSFGASVMVRCEVRLRMRVARPIARGRNRLSVGPSSATTEWIRSSSPTSSWLFSALEIADSSSLLQAFAAPRDVRARIARAWGTSLPRMWSQTSRALRAEVRTYLAWARTSTPGSAAGRRPLRPRDAARAAGFDGASGCLDGLSFGFLAAGFFAAGLD